MYLKLERHIWGSQSPQTVIREERICKVQGAEGAQERDAEASQSQVCSVQASRGPRAPLPASPTPTTLQSWLVDKAGCESAGRSGELISGKHEPSSILGFHLFEGPLALWECLLLWIHLFPLMT